MVSPIFKKYEGFEEGVINVGSAASVPVTALRKLQNFYLKDGLLRKLPGLAEINGTAIGADPVWSVFSGHHIYPDKAQRLAASGSKIYKFNDQSDAFEELYSGLNANKQIEFLEEPPYVYFGSQFDDWRKFEIGTTLTYKIGNTQAPPKASQILYNAYAQRYFAIGDLTDKDKLKWSNHIDDGGIEIWPDANNQVIESESGDYPQRMAIYEGTVTMASQHSIHSGDVTGVPEIWDFRREKAKTGTIAGRTFKRWGTSFLMLSPSLEVYAWPDDVFITKEKIKFDINPHKAHLACAEIVEDRFYYLVFESSEAVSQDKYHLWIYDLIGKRWSGPHKYYNLVSLFYDRGNNVLLCGGSDDLAGFVLEHRGRDIKGRKSPGHIISSYHDYDYSRIDKRYSKFYMTCSQEGVLPSNAGQVEVIVNVDGKYNNPQSQRLSLIDDPAPNSHIADTGDIREVITKRAHIEDAYGLGNRIQVEIKHEVQNGDFAIKDFEIGFKPLGKKEQIRV